MPFHKYFIGIHVSWNLHKNWAWWIEPSSQRTHYALSTSMPDASGRFCIREAVRFLHSNCVCNARSSPKSLPLCFTRSIAYGKADIMPSEITANRNRLWIARKKAGLGQKTAARLMGFKSISQISEYEHNRLLPSLRTAFKLSIIYEVPLAELYLPLYDELREEIRQRRERSPRPLAPQREREEPFAI